MNTKSLHKIESRLRRLEIALNFRKRKYQVTPTSYFYRQFPAMKGRKFYLVKWVDDERVKILTSGTQKTYYFSASYFDLG